MQSLQMLIVQSRSFTPNSVAASADELDTGRLVYTETHFDRLFAFTAMCPATSPANRGKKTFFSRIKAQNLRGRLRSHIFRK